MLIAALLFAVPALADEVAWVKDFNAALTQASEQKKLVILDLSASWCGYCRRMAREVYPDPKFVEFSRSLVLVRLFADTDEQGTELAGRFKIRGFPTILVLDARGQELGRVEGARDRDSLIREIQEITKRPSPLRL